jgi:four helix bundle protein
MENIKYQSGQEQPACVAVIVAERLLSFAAGNTKLMTRLTRTVAGRYMSHQLMRSSASAGANYEEARGGESKADFIHRLQIALKELREAKYWLKLIDRAELIPHTELVDLHKEAEELAKIVARSVLTAKSKQEPI